MPKTIRHLRQEDRRIIARLIKQKASQVQIAELLGFSQGTISKEVSKNFTRPGQAHSRALQRKASKIPRATVITEAIAAMIVVKLECNYSPEQIYTDLHRSRLPGST